MLLQPSDRTLYFGAKGPDKTLFCIMLYPIQMYTGNIAITQKTYMYFGFHIYTYLNIHLNN